MGHVVDHDDTIRPTVICTSDGAETLLARCVPLQKQKGKRRERVGRRKNDTCTGARKIYEHKYAKPKMPMESEERVNLIAGTLAERQKLRD